MHSKVEKVFQNCLPCIMAKIKTGKPEGMLHLIEKAALLDTYHIADHLGSMQSTKKWYKQLVSAVVDALLLSLYGYTLPEVRVEQSFSIVLRSKQSFSGIQDESFLTKDPPSFTSMETARSLRWTA